MSTFVRQFLSAKVITHFILLTQATQQHIFCPVWGHKTFPHDLRFCLKFMAHFMSFYGCTLNQIMEKIVIMSGYWVALFCNFFYFLLSKESKGIGKFYLATLVHPVRENLIQMHPGSIPCLQNLTPHPMPCIEKINSSPMPCIEKLTPRPMPCNENLTPRPMSCNEK